MDGDYIDGLHVNYLTACITPFHTYQPSEINQYRIPYGDVRITFDGGMGNFNNLTNGEYPGYNRQLEFTFQYELHGLPSLCEKCRIQVTGGSDCSQPKIRYWDRSVEGAYNPWREEYGAIYTSNKHGIARGYFSMFDGFNFDQHKSRTVVVFDRDSSTRIGCGVVRRKDFGKCSMNENTTSPTLSPEVQTIAPGVFPTVSPSLPFPTPSPSPTVLYTPDPTLYSVQPSAKNTSQPSLYTPPPSSRTPTPLPSSSPSLIGPTAVSQHPTDPSTKTPTSQPSRHYDKTSIPSRRPTIRPLFTPRPSSRQPTDEPTERGNGKKSKKTGRSKKRVR